MASESRSEIKHTILVMSGKGGVGKSTFTACLAVAALHRGLRVGILDIDLCGPSQPRIFGLQGKTILQNSSSGGWIPVHLTTPLPISPSESTSTTTATTATTGQLLMISLAFLLVNRDDPVIWRGPKKTSTIKSFIEDVHWGDLDLLIIDTPPGTSDEHLSVVEALLSRRATQPLDGAIVLTTPQRASLSDVRKEIAFCQKAGLKILGVCENMAGYLCPSCSECSLIFASGGGRALAEELQLPFLGSLPIDPLLTELADHGRILSWSPPSSAFSPSSSSPSSSFPSSLSAAADDDSSPSLSSSSLSPFDLALNAIEKFTPSDS